jgi:hypothetical protein
MYEVMGNLAYYPPYYNATTELCLPPISPPIVPPDTSPLAIVWTSLLLLAQIESYSITHFSVVQSFGGIILDHSQQNKPGTQSRRARTVASRRREPDAGSMEDLARLQRSSLKSDLFVAAQKTKREDAGNFEDFKVCSVDVEKVSGYKPSALAALSIRAIPSVIGLCLNTYKHIQLP